MNELKKLLLIFVSLILMASAICVCSVAYAADSTVKYENDPPVNVPRAPNATGSYGPDLCAMGSSAAASLAVIGYSQGSQYIDEICRSIRLSKQMNTLGLKVGAVSLLCINNKDVIIALYHAGSPCPVTLMGETLVGVKAEKFWSQFKWITEHYVALGPRSKSKPSRNYSKSTGKSELHPRY